MSHVSSKAASLVLSTVERGAAADDHAVAKAVCAAISSCAGGAQPELSDALPRVRNLRRALADATVSFLREVGRADAEGALSVPAYVSLAGKLSHDNLEVVERTMASLLPPPVLDMDGPS
jgi:hypothetical protein